MPKHIDERLEDTRIMHETLQMMLELMEALGFKPQDVRQDQGIEMGRTGTAALRDERITHLHKGYHDMVEQKNRLERTLASLERRDAGSLEQPARRKMAQARKPPRRKGKKWTRQKRH